MPYEEWATDYIVPSKLCVTSMKVCTRTNYNMPGDSVMVEAGDGKQSTKKPPNIFDPSALLVHLVGKVRFLMICIIVKASGYVKLNPFDILVTLYVTIVW